MEKRLPLALVLSLLFIWWYLGVNPPPVPPEDDSTPEQTVESSEPQMDAGPVSIPDRPSGAAGAPGATVAVAQVPLEPSKPVSFSGRGYVAQFGTRGGGLEWLELTDYHTEPNGEVDLRLITPGENDRTSLLMRDFNDRYPLDRVSWDTAVSTTPGGRRQIVFTWTAPDGMQFRRTITDRDRLYEFDLSIDVLNGGTENPGGAFSMILEGPYGLVDDRAQSFITIGPTALAILGSEDGEEVTKWTRGKLADGPARTVGQGERLVAAGSMTNYFAGLLVPAEGTHVSQVKPEPVLDTTRLATDVASHDPANQAEADAWRAKLEEKHRDNASVSLLLSARAPAAGQSLHYDFGVYIGPKDRDLAEQPEYAFLHPMLEDAFGRMAWINHGLLAILRFFHGLLGNWGFAIILLTIVVKGLLFPLNRVQQSGMAKYSATMQRLKPEIDELKAKYKSNKRKFNEEQMKLMRAHGASPPLGGCLLMFLQFPIWVALFQILKSSIELRHSPFVFWVKDLSQADRMIELSTRLPIVGWDALNLLPILMAGATMLQMKFQPKPADDSQAQMQKTMGMMMPVVMLFFLYNYPAGLSLYIFTSSLIGIFEFRVIRRFWPVPGAPPVGKAAVAVAGGASSAPPARRGGGGKPKGKGRR